MSWFRLLLILLVLPLAACAVSGPRLIAKSDLTTHYTLDAGDVVKVSVYGDDSISRTYRIADDGTIALPLVGPVSVRGMTTEQAAAAVAKGLATGYMRNPNVTVEVDTYRPFYISGTVTNPGQFAYVPGMTVRAAVSTAGGFSDGAPHARVTIFRKQGGEMVKSRVDIDFPILAGDTIVVD